MNKYRLADAVLGACNEYETELGKRDLEIIRLRALCKEYLDANFVGTDTQYQDSISDIYDGEPQFEKEDKCTCDTEEYEEHPCPFSADVYDEEKTCSCCPHCYDQCVESI